MKITTLRKGMSSPVVTSAAWLAFEHGFYKLIINLKDKGCFVNQGYSIPTSFDPEKACITFLAYPDDLSLMNHTEIALESESKEEADLLKSASIYEMNDNKNQFQFLFVPKSFILKGKVIAKYPMR